MKTKIYHLVCTTRFLNNLHHVLSRLKDSKTKLCLMWGRCCLPFWSTWIRPVSYLIFDVVKLHVFHVLVPCCDVRYHFRVKTMFVLIPICVVHVLFKLFVFIYAYWCPSWFLYHTMFVRQHDRCHMWSIIWQPFRRTWVHPGFSGNHVARSLVCCEMFCKSLLVHFRVAIVVSILLRFTASNYPCCIFKLLLWPKLC
jgi:hypothetical protein